MKSAADILCSWFEQLLTGDDRFTSYSYLVNKKVVSPVEIILCTEDATNSILPQREMRGGEMAERRAVQVLLRHSDQVIAMNFGFVLMNLVDSFPALTQEQRTVTIPADGEPDGESSVGTDAPAEVVIANIQRFTGVQTLENPETGNYETLFSVRLTI